MTVFNLCTDWVSWPRFFYLVSMWTFGPEWRQARRAITFLKGPWKWLLRDEQPFRTIFRIYNVFPMCLKARSQESVVGNWLHLNMFYFSDIKICPQNLSLVRWSKNSLFSGSVSQTTECICKCSGCEYILNPSVVYAKHDQTNCPEN